MEVWLTFLCSLRLLLYQNMALSETLPDDKVDIVDGSTGYVLLQEGLPEDDLFRLIWSARALVEPRYHDIVKTTHKKYLDVGAKFITTNSYATQPTYYERAFSDTIGRTVVAQTLGAEWLQKEVTDERDWQTLMLRHATLSSRLAQEARSEYLSGLQESGREGGSITVLGSMPPLVESHRPDLFAKSHAANGVRWFVDHYKSLAGALLEGGVDMLLLETMNCWTEAECGMQAVKEVAEQHGKVIKLVVSFEGSLRRERDLQPQPQLAPVIVERVLAFDLGDLVELVAVGFNCAPPEDILDALRELSDTNVRMKLERRSVKLLVYANLHERDVYDEGFSIEGVDVSPVTLQSVSDPEQGELIRPVPQKTRSRIRRRQELFGYDGVEGYLHFSQQVRSKYRVNWIGGCCGCGPEGIQAIAGSALVLSGVSLSSL